MSARVANFSSINLMLHIFCAIVQYTQTFTSNYVTTTDVWIQHIMQL
jgi:hypothetical protein